jgi:hypothetical protein
MTWLRSPEDWGDAYADLRATYEVFVERLEELIRSLTYDEGLDYAESVWSTMKVEAFVTEIYTRAREGAFVVDPLSTFTDLGVVTFLTRTKAESESICALVEREFEVDAETSLSFEAAEESNRDLAAGGHEGRMFYDYPRLVVSVTTDRKELPEWRAFEGLRAEIRVKTLLQRLWQEVDEQLLPYIWDSSYPDAVQDLVLRALTCVSEADDALSRIGDVTAEVEDGYEHAVDRDEFAERIQRIDLSALFVYIRDSDTVARLIAAAQAAGMRRDPDPVYVSEGDRWLVHRCGFDSLSALDSFLRQSESRAPDVYRRFCELTEAEDDFVPWASAEAVVVWLLLVLTRADAELIMLSRYRSSIETALNTLIGNQIER